MTRKISVFIASPSDLAIERRLFRDAIHQLNIGFGDGADVEFEALGWEDTLAEGVRAGMASAYSAAYSAAAASVAGDTEDGSARRRIRHAFPRP